MTLVAPAPSPGPSREYRATVTFAIAGLFVLVVVLLVGGLISTSPPIRGVVVLFGVLLGMVAMLATALGLAYGRAWAVAAATPLLVLLVIAGAIDFVVALTHNSIQFPIGGILALWALRAPLRTVPQPDAATRRWGPAGAFVVGAMLLSTGWPVVSPILLSVGGPLVVDDADILPSLAVTCDGAPGAQPTSIHIRYDWRWARSELLVAGSDTVTLAAYSVDDDGQPLYAIDSTDATSGGVWQSDIMIFNPMGIVFGIDLAEAGFQPGSVGFTLVQASETPTAHGSVDVRVTYLHGPADTSGPNVTALWQSETSARCEW